MEKAVPIGAAVFLRPLTPAPCGDSRCPFRGSHPSFPTVLPLFPDGVLSGVLTLFLWTLKTQMENFFLTTAMEVI